MKSWALALYDNDEVREVAPEETCHNEIAAVFRWIHLDGQEADTLAWLKEHGGVPETVLIALTAVETRPRTEQVGSGTLVNLRGLKDDPDATGDPLVSIRLWTERGRVITVSFRRMGGLDELRKEMEGGAIRDPGDLISRLAVIITRRLDPVVADLGDRIDDCEVTLDTTRTFEMRKTIAAARSQAIAYRRFVVPQRMALERIAELDANWLEEGDRLHLREAADRFARMGEELEAVRERSALLHEQITDLRAEQIDTRTLLLSIAALVFLPLTFLTGLLGMNVEGIPYAHEPWAFAAVVGLCAMIATVITAYFVYTHWTQR
jgi:zinc transporter